MRNRAGYWNCWPFSRSATKTAPCRSDKMLAYLLEEKGLKPSDLWSILPKSRVSEILRGKRSISKQQAKKLAEFFHVPTELFL